MRSIPLTQTALEVTEIGKPVVKVDNRPVPNPGPSQLLLRVLVAGLNPHDQKVRDLGLHTGGRLPVILANDVVGEIVKLGDKVDTSRFQIGDHVVTQASPYGGNGLQQYAVADVQFSSKYPSFVSDDDANTLPTNIIALVVALFDVSALNLPAPWTPEAKAFDYNNTTLLIIGGGSNCGRYAVQLASLAKVRHIVVVGGDESELKSYGAEVVLDRHGSETEVLERIRALVGDELTYVLDVVNPPDGQMLGLNALSSSKHGKFARLRPSRPLDESKVLGKKAGFEIKDIFGSSHAFPDTCVPFWERLHGYLEDGKIKTLEYEVVKGLDVDKVNDVLDRYRDGKKVVHTHFHVSG